MRVFNCIVLYIHIYTHFNIDQKLITTDSCLSLFLFLIQQTLFHLHYFFLCDGYLKLTVTMYYDVIYMENLGELIVLLD